MYKRTNQGWFKHIDFILWDVAALQLAFVLAYSIRHGWVWAYFSEPYRRLAIMYTVVDILIAIMANTMRNVMKRGLYQEFAKSFKHVVLVLTIIALYMFSWQSGSVYSRTVIYLTAFFHLIFGYMIRQLWKRVVLWRGSKKPKVAMVLVTDEHNVPEIVTKTSPTDYFEYRGLVLSNRDAEGETIEGIPVVANLSNAADYICRGWVDEVFVYPSHLTDISVQQTNELAGVEGFIYDTLNVSAITNYKIARKDTNNTEMGTASVATLIEQCRQMAIPVHIRLPLSNIGSKSFLEKVGSYNVLTTTSYYTSPLQLTLKRMLDIAGGIVGSILALLIIAVVGPKIKKESPGPILFKQTRIGLNGRKFTCYKIRSMYMDAEERKAELMKQNRISDGMMFKMDWDPRIIGNKIVNGKQVTGIGEYIRSRSLDEFPQFFNVLLNDMSLVGTRPPTEDEWEKYKYHHRARLATKPGITGMWQVSGRSEITDFEEVVRLDTEYIDNWSIGLDLRILLKTIKVVLNKDGAM